MNTHEQETTPSSHSDNCRLLEASPAPSTFLEYRAWLGLWRSVYQEETLRARTYRSALRRFHQAGGSGRKQPLFPMTPEIEAAAQRSTNEYDRPGRARLCAQRIAYKPLGSQLWKTLYSEERL